MIKKLAKYIGEYKLPTILTPILITLEVIMEVIIPLKMADLIDYGVYAGNMNEVWKLRDNTCNFGDVFIIFSEQRMEL